MKTLQLTKLPKTENWAVAVGNAINKFRDGFVLWFDTDTWEESWSNQGTWFRWIWGNSVWAWYFLLSMCPLTPNMEYKLTSKEMFKMPIRFWYGLSISQRILWQEIEVSFVWCTVDWVVQENSVFAPLNISGSITVTSNVATVNFASPHWLVGADRVALVWNTENRLNVGPVALTVVNSTQITVPCTLANGTYTAGGQVVWIDQFWYAKNAVWLIHENTTATNATFATRRNGSRHVWGNNTIASTAANQFNTSPYTDAFRSTQDNEIIGCMEFVKYISRTASSISAASGNNKFTETLPDEWFYYKIRLRVKNLPNFTYPIAEIASCTKSGTTTGTFTTVNPIGLPNGTYQGQVYWVRDQTNFPNQTAMIAFTVTGTNTFTAVIGATTTGTSEGWVLVLNQWSILLPGALNFSVQSIQRTNNIMTITLNTTASGLLLGEYCHLFGMSSSWAPYDGSYKVLRLTWSTVEVDSQWTNFGSITCGWAIIKRTDARLHYARLLDYTRLLMEISNNRWSNDASESIPVTLAVTPSVTQWSAAALGTAGTGAWTVRGWAVRIVDIASAAITSTATSASISLVDIVWSHQFTVDTTAVSGTWAFMRPRIQVSGDGWTNFPFNIYDFPRVINSTDKTLMSPILPVEFANMRYVRTIWGTTPSFTNSVVRTVRAGWEAKRYRQLNDIALSLASAPGTWSTEYLYTDGCTKAQLISTPMTWSTTPPALKLQWCNGDPTVATNWFDITGGTITTSITAPVATDTINIPACKFLRFAVTTSAVGTITALYDLFIKAWEG